MRFPETITELAGAGYRFENDGVCKGCHAKIEWWKSPRGKMLPMDVNGDGSCKPHWTTCPKAADFRKTW
jgi:hypothetical protein